MRDKRIIINVLLILFFLTSLVGCISKLGDFESNSHFAYPNSNVTALGPVQASVTKYGFVLGLVIDKAWVTQVYNDALKKSGGDLLIDYKFDTSTTMIWPFSATTLSVEGTAAKMVLGKKELK